MIFIPARVGRRPMGNSRKSPSPYLSRKGAGEEQARGRTREIPDPSAYATMAPYTMIVNPPRGVNDAQNDACRRSPLHEPFRRPRPS